MTRYEFRTDFYRYLPSWMPPVLNTMMRLHGSEPWFQKAWEDYRNVAMVTPMSDIPMIEPFFEHAEKRYCEILVEDRTGESFANNNADDLYFSETHNPSMNELEAFFKED